LVSVVTVLLTVELTVELAVCVALERSTDGSCGT
jgi:hypothetical protein